MTHHYDSSASGYILDPFEGISQTFTDVEILSTSEVNIVAKAKRYGRWWLLKELPLREELYYLCKNECPYMHIYSDLESDAKVGISKPGQGIGGLKRCA